MDLGDDELYASVEAVWACGEERDEDELDFAKGDVIELLSRSYRGDSDWWFGSLRGAFGKFPSNYVRELDGAGRAATAAAAAAAVSAAKQPALVWLGGFVSALALGAEGVAALVLPRESLTVPILFRPQAHCFHKVTNEQCFASFEGMNLYIVAVRLFGCAMIGCALLALAHGRAASHLALGVVHSTLFGAFRFSALHGIQRARGFNSALKDPNSEWWVATWASLSEVHLAFAAVAALTFVVVAYGAFARWWKAVATYKEVARLKRE